MISNFGGRHLSAFLQKGHLHTHVHQVHGDDAVGKLTHTVNIFNGDGDCFTVQCPLHGEIIAVQHDGALAAGLQFHPGLTGIDLRHLHGHTQRFGGNALVLARIGVRLATAAGCQRQQHGNTQQNRNDLFQIRLSFQFIEYVILVYSLLPQFWQNLPPS